MKFIDYRLAWGSVSLKIKVEELRKEVTGLPHAYTHVSMHTYAHEHMHIP